MSVFWDSECRFFGTPDVGMSVFGDSECRPDVGFSILLFILLYIKDEKAVKVQQGFLFFSNFCSVFYVFLFPTPFLYLQNGTKKPCDCSNHRVSLVRLTGLEPACLGNTRSLVLRVCQFRHDRTCDCSALSGTIIIIQHVFIKSNENFL